MASLSSRPLRQPLKSKSSTPQYGRISRATNLHKTGGSLPLFPTQQAANLQTTSSSLVNDGSFRGMMEKSSSVPLQSDPPVVGVKPTDKPHRLPANESRHAVKVESSRGPVDLGQHQPVAIRSSSARFSKQDAPGNEPNSKSRANVAPESPRAPKETALHRPARASSREESCTTCEMSESSTTTATTTRGKIRKEVRFNTVQVHFAEPGRRPTQAMELDTYENERGPTRTPEFFLKSEAELRDVRRIQQIEDARADEEWQAIRDLNTEIQADVEERVPGKSKVLSDSEEHGLGISFQGERKKKKRWLIGGLFKRKQKPHPLADI